MRGVFVPFLSVTLLLAFSTESTSLASSPPSSSSSSSSSSEPFITLSSPYHECCQYLQNQQQEYQLINCINTTITTYDIPTIPTIIPYYQQRLGPKLFITLMTRITPEIYNYAAYSYFLQAIYANINGYLLLPLYDDSNMEDYSLYRKLAPIQEALLGISADCDYIVWMDAG